MNDVEVEDFLQHFGIKGMHWGVRSSHPGGVSRAVDKHAKKDAQEFARAKAFYGEGAGTRRKLIKATVEGKTKHMPGYKQAFDRHLENQDPSKHASKAVAERTRTDRKKNTKQTAGAVARRITGEPGTRAAFVAVAAGGVAFLNSPRGRATMNKTAASLKTFVNSQKQKRGAAKIMDFINKGV